MTPLEFLGEEFLNVQRALRDTLRHDYGPEQSGEYYRECEARLNEINLDIAALVPTDFIKIYSHLRQLSNVTNFVSLIERSRLGEFSWPFAEELRKIAKSLLAEANLKGGRIEPIIHVVAEGEGYRIFYESPLPMASSRQRFMVVFFPRSLKHHVLLHAVFGHEIGHNALSSTVTGGILQAQVVRAFVAAGPLSSVATMNAWLTSAAAPQDAKLELAAHTAKSNGRPFVLLEEHRKYWLMELICDLFGFLLFGPAFFAAHRVYLQALHPRPYAINTVQPTHPPYAIRHKMLVRIMHLMGWNTAITSIGDGNFYSAETETLKFLLDDPYDPWAQLFDDAQLRAAIAGVKATFTPHGTLEYAPSNSVDLVNLLSRISRGLPPIIADVDQDGKPVLAKVHIAQTLYAGWIYWIGRCDVTVSSAEWRQGKVAGLRGICRDPVGRRRHSVLRKRHAPRQLVLRTSRRQPQ